MTAEIAHDRILNGLLKGFGGAVSPDEFESRLGKSIEIVVPPMRSTELWPAIWALASILERQSRGLVFVNAGMTQAPFAPSPLGPRVKFVDGATPSDFKIAVATETAGHPANTVVADAAAGRIAVGGLLSPASEPSPVECFALAGYLGFRALAALAGIPSYREDFASGILEIPVDAVALAESLRASPGYTCVGLGQVGQAMLALLYFLYHGDYDRRRLNLIDPDIFVSENQRTQILLGERQPWLNAAKATYMEELCRSWNAEALGESEAITWGWKRGSRPSVGLVGPHDFETRRMACAAKFDAMIECGVGTNFLQPRVSWNVLRGDAERWRGLFADREVRSPEVAEASWVRALKASPGACGWVQFLGISATAPCLGVAAAAFAMAQFSQSVSGGGTAGLWSQLLPLQRFALT